MMSRSLFTSARMGFSLLCFCVLFGCELPKDQRGTTERIEREGEIRAGYSAQAEELAAERAWLAALGERKNARIEEMPGEAHQLVEALRRGEIDLIIDMPAKSPFAKEVGLSRPYPNPQERAQKRAWAVRPGENAWLYEVDRLLMQETPR